MPLRIKSVTQLETILNECREAVAAGEIGRALDSLAAALPETDRETRNEAILQRSKLKRIEEQERKGTVSHSDAQAQRNQLTHNVLQYIDIIAERLRRHSAPNERKSIPATMVEASGEKSAEGSLPVLDEFDAFLSHNSQDKPIVREMARRLEARGLRVWLDEKDLPAGQPWIPQLEEGLARVRAVVVLLGPGELGPWQRAEIWLGLRKAFERGATVSAVWLPGVTTRPVIPEFLKLFTWLDFSLGLTEEGINRLAQAITNKPAK